VVLPGDDLESSVLDLVAVLEGLVDDSFEILLLAGDETPEIANLRARGHGLPLRLIDGNSIADGCDAAQYELILVAAQDGQYDVRELNHLLDSIEQGADVAVGYRPRRTDVLVRQLHRWGWSVELDVAFGLMRKEVWQRLKQAGRHNSGCAELLASVRRLGFNVAEVSVSHHRPTLGSPVSAGWQAA